MISDLIENWRDLPGLNSHPVWRAAFEWIEERAASAEIGVFDLGIGAATVRVMEYGTKSRGEARYEAHRSTIDLQYTIEGAEGIEVVPTKNLEPDGDYDSTNDFEFFKTPATSAARVDNVEGRFTVLYPQDGHMPQLQVGDLTSVRKLVVKIPVSSL